ncbi:MAG: transposase [Synechococcaceae cyanobacterium SM2_3_2]|nr:transposase [Synechococcaceae cyanobacterium SM2_3_2]
MRRQSSGFKVLPVRWLVERTFAWLSMNRPLSRDYEQLEATREAWVYLGMVRLMLNGEIELPIHPLDLCLNVH